MKSKPIMTREEARAWKERWRTVNETTIREARAQTVEQRFHDLELLFASAHLFPIRNDEAEVAEVRARWARLRESYSG